MLVHPKGRRFHLLYEDAQGKDKGRFFMLRQILNLVFIITSIAGVVIYMIKSHDMGAYVLISGMAFKFAELSLRIVKF